MAVDFLQMLFEVLRVENLAGQYYTPLDQFLYVVFFPSIFIILIIYMIAGQVAKGHGPRGFSVILGVAIYVFIIVWPPNETYSLYSAVAPIGKVWFILIIILVGIWAIFKTFFPGGGGAPGKEARSVLGSQIMGRVWRQASGKVGDLEKMIEGELKALESIANKMKHAKSSVEFKDSYQAFPMLNDEVWKHLNELRQMVEVSGFKVGAKRYDDFLKRYQHICESIRREESKRRG